ncbi:MULTISPECIES: PepSY domain-containing protein [Shouchella]|uniref:PepSY domain-containing protein n=2 Tax=Shouchella TaxID=2893057 RepID=A0ABY7WD93_9BACI|nr:MULTISPECIES: PepSY domain-containing protein [Shouchella]MED4128059.1 PepSY domain-containing protein [Shouchella miscanthi]WDF05623.1 PepSY domain-containing protein [Shouchella hunanensis]GAF21587.1 lipoprotein [Bacillus sp. JCM 19047]
MKKTPFMYMTVFTALSLLAACNQDEGPGEMNPNPEPGTVEEDNGAQENETMMSYIRLDDALQHFNNAFPDASLTSVKYDAQNLHYELDGIDDDSEYELVIHAETEEEINQQTEPLDAEDAGGVEREREAIELEGLIEPTDAVGTAQNEISGAMRSWELERDGNRIYYEVKIEVDQEEHEVTIDAESGEIIEIDRD